MATAIAGIRNWLIAFPSNVPTARVCRIAPATKTARLTTNASRKPSMA
jgi:hypothetical protein